MTTMTDIQASLKSSGMRITKPRLAVAKVLLSNKGNLLSSEIIYQRISAKAGDSCDQVSVYRALATFTKLGFVQKSQFQGEAARYKFVEIKKAKKSHSHEHFFKCRKCQTIESFDECFVSQKEKSLEEAGYKDVAHHLEISGICPSCTSSQKN